MAKPNPISAIAVRSQDIIVRSRLSRVRIQPKWLSVVTLTSTRFALGLCLQLPCLVLLPVAHVPLDVSSSLPHPEPLEFVTKTNAAHPRGRFARAAGAPTWSRLARIAGRGPVFG